MLVRRPPSSSEDSESAEEDSAEDEARRQEEAPGERTQHLDGADVRILLRLIFTPRHLPASSLHGGQSTRWAAPRDEEVAAVGAGGTPLGREVAAVGAGGTPLGRAMRHVPSCSVQPLLHGEVSVTLTSIEQRRGASAAKAQQDGIRGPFDQPGEPWSGLLLRVQERSGRPRTAIGFQAVQSGGAQPPALLLTDQSTNVGGGASASERASGKASMSAAPDPVAAARATLAIGDEWTISCWFMLQPTGGRQGRQLRRRVLAMGLPPPPRPSPPPVSGEAGSALWLAPSASDARADEVEGEGGEGGISSAQRDGQVRPVCHVMAVETRGGLLEEDALQLGVESIHPDDPTQRRQTLLAEFDLLQLPHGCEGCTRRPLICGAPHMRLRPGSLLRILPQALASSPSVCRCAAQGTT